MSGRCRCVKVFVHVFPAPFRSGTWRPCAAPRTSACGRSATPWRWWSPAWTPSSRTSSSLWWVGTGLCEEEEKFINDVEIHWETVSLGACLLPHCPMLSKFTAGRKLPPAAKLLVNVVVTVISSKFDITWLYSVKNSYITSWKTFPSSWKMFSTFQLKCFYFIIYVGQEVHLSN